jgi:probable HAF family extracellular repeat protein
VNTEGTVVGESEYSRGTQNVTRAFRWQASVGNKMTNLNRFLPKGTKVELRRAYGINGAGWIVGYEHDGATGARRGFVLIP